MSKEILIVDGYNIISKWEELRELKDLDIGAAREQLLEFLSDFQPWPWSRILVVFDAYRVSGREAVWENVRGVEVVFTGEGETADTFIERQARLLAADYHVVVATSDRLESREASSCGTTVTFAAGELREKLREYRREIMAQAACKQSERRLTLEGRIKGTVRKTLEQWRRRKD